MTTWLVIAALATIGITALLIGVLVRVNKGALERAAGRAEGPRAGQHGPAEASGENEAERKR